MTEYAIMVNIDNCIGCRACQIACKVWNGLKAELTSFNPEGYTNPVDLTPNTWMIIEFIEGTRGGEPYWIFKKFQCMHCSEAPCAKACPVNAIEVHPEGAVVIRSDKCVGCQYCIEACPYDVPRYDPVTNKVYKCTLCIDRIQNGLAPACVEACPTEALVFGPYDELVRKYREAGFEIYGDKVNSYVGRTHYLYATRKYKDIGSDEGKKWHEVLGLPSNPQAGLPVIKAGRDIGAGLAVAALAGAVLHAVYWRAKRIEERKKQSS
ncbi:4Fe-4S dicluster domain-containing protein [Hyperthermus butylicus]|uniref:Formate dehydrogenase, nitrate-inducible, iron-sulfur subunit n=1 Tax=Hyperthermus butylicus (strain DSM 5456 / JCM 9403 / PLM1-5) TaxID=415426 RepID=A2BLN4_HYPBU|nr:4Fe-4S dicluster domain-containing protein [Hyperthermus butylicus]ABM80895.1 Formate dehydrogenase, nitrate-inducible, iron-sulfur subunit [Hyperthermus butylicus DSM 5456]